MKFESRILLCYLFERSQCLGHLKCIFYNEIGLNKYNSACVKHVPCL